MIQIYSSIKYIIGRVFEKYYSLSLGEKILSVYLVVLIPFLYFHEKHLPIGIVLILILFALVFSFLLGLGNFRLLEFLFEREFHLFTELSFYAVNLLLYFALGLFDNRAGIILLFFCILMYLPFRIQENRVFYRISILGIISLSTGLLTFQILRGGEWALFHLQLKFQQNEIEIDPANWEIQQKKLTHKDIPLTLHLSENMFFHKPSKTLGEYRSTGNLLGVISNSDSDPNVYPYIKIYFIPSIFYMDLQTLSIEFEKYLEFEKNQGDIEALQVLGESTLKNKHKGRFWIFYDNLRPKDAKAGFYSIVLKNGSTILLEIREKLSEAEFHVPEIQEILDKLEIPE